jgi:hypothetical protein
MARQAVANEPNWRMLTWGTDPAEKPGVRVMPRAARLGIRDQSSEMEISCRAVEAREMAACQAGFTAEAGKSFWGTPRCEPVQPSFFGIDVNVEGSQRAPSLPKGMSPSGPVD